VEGHCVQSKEEADKIFYIDWQPNQIYRTIYLPADVVPELATAELHSGMLEFNLPRYRRRRNKRMTH
jgi:HSP20 family molecular chaperone IbpA